MFWTTQLVLLLIYLLGIVLQVRSPWLIALPALMATLVLVRLAGALRRR
jgi:hypothetical protein